MFLSAVSAAFFLLLDPRSKWLLSLQDEHVADQSHIVGAEMSVYDFDYDDNAYPVTSNELHSGARWVEGYSALPEAPSHQAAPHCAGLKLRVSNQHVVRLVTVDCNFTAHPGPFISCEPGPEEPLVVHRCLTWWLIDVCGFSAILLAVHLASKSRGFV